MAAGLMLNNNFLLFVAPSFLSRIAVRYYNKFFKDCLAHPTSDKECMPTPEQLRPKTKQTVEQILSILKLPRASSNYDWCFGKAAGTCVMFQWIDQIDEVDGRIQFIETSEQWVNANRDVAETVQVNRAWAVHNLVLTAYMTKRPIHVAIVDGDSRFTQVGEPTKGLVKETGQAKYRVLDTELWWPHHRDPLTKQIVVVRGEEQPKNYDPSSDSFITTTLSSSVEPGIGSSRKESKTMVYERDSAVVQEAKARANSGQCEYCGQNGFETAPGKYYLEAHHVIPISEDGPDSVWNIAVLCANDHRRAHFGVDRDEVRNRLIETLRVFYPKESAKLIELAKKLEVGRKA